MIFEIARSKFSIVAITFRPTCFAGNNRNNKRKSSTSSAQVVLNVFEP